MPRLQVRKIAEAQGLTLTGFQLRCQLGTKAARRYWHGTATGAPTGPALDTVRLSVLAQIAAALGVQWWELAAEDHDDL